MRATRVSAVVAAAAVGVVGAPTHLLLAAHVERVLRDVDLGEGAAIAKILGCTRHKALALAVRRWLLHR